MDAIDKESCQTGYFGIPGGPESRSTLVHVVDEDTNPICGTRLSEEQVFQWCGPRIAWQHIECENCRRILRSHPARPRYMVLD